MRTGRMSAWLRLTCALILAVGFSAATSAAGESVAKPATTTLSHRALATASAQTATLRTATNVRHAIAKHHVPATAGALAVVASALIVLTALSVRRRRTDNSVRHHALSLGPRAPPAVSSC